MRRQVRAAVWLTSMVSAAALYSAAGVQAQPAPPTTLSGIEVVATIKRVADWALAHQTSRDPAHWSMAPLDDGLIDASLVTRAPNYLASEFSAGSRLHFVLGSRIYHA